MSVHQQPLSRGNCKKLVTNFLLLVILSFSASVFADPSHYRITGNGGWGHFKLGNNADNLWGPKISPAVGQSHLELTLNGNGSTDWNLLAIKSGGSSVILGDHINGQPNGFFTVSIPLSAFSSDAFTDISNMSVPFARGPDSIDLSVAMVAFTGSGTPTVWYGDDQHLDNAYDSNWDVTFVAGDGNTEPTDSDNDGTPDATDNCPTIANADQADNDNDGQGNVCDSTPNGPVATDTDGDSIPDSQDNCPVDDNTDQADADEDGIGDVCDPTPNGNPTGPVGSFNYYHVTGNGGWGHFKLGHNNSNLWGPKISPSVGQTHLRLTLNGFNETNWDEFAITTDGTSDKVVLGDHISGSPAGWFSVDIPLSAFPADAFTNIANMSVPFSRGADSINIGIAAVEFVGGSDAFIWFGNPGKIDNVFDAQWDVTPSTDSTGPTGPADADNDGVVDAEDNCPTTANTNQADNDNDGIGNVCDTTPNGPDADGDGVIDSADNCPNNANTNQADNDNDGLGNVCDSTPNGPVVTDTDGDGIEDSQDNCPAVSNQNQADTDNDGIGDACDTSGPQTSGIVNLVGATSSTDEKATLTAANAIDDLTSTRWASQLFSDDEWIYVDLGSRHSVEKIDLSWEAAYAEEYEIQVSDDASSWVTVFSETAGNGATDNITLSPAVDGRFVRILAIKRGSPWGYSLYEIDVTGTNLGGGPTGPSDVDGDGVADTTDNCPAISNADQADADSDGTGDLCDDTPNGPVVTDSDNDGVPNTTDNCPVIANADQLDSDGDNIGDACDQNPMEAAKATFGNFVGINSLINTPEEAIAPFKNLRIYFPMNLVGEFATSGNDLAFAPSDSWWLDNVDEALQTYSQNDRDVMLVLQHNLPYFGDFGQSIVPIKEGTDGNAAEDWDIYYDICFQLAARYGKNNTSNGVSVRGDNQALTGLDYISRIEPRNESHMWWIGSNRTVTLPNGTTETRKNTDFTPEEEASMMVACTNGAKAADPLMSTSIPGTPGWDRNILSRLKGHAELINSGDKLADDYVTNVYWNGKHANLDYRYTQGLDFGTGGVHPEDPSLDIQLQDFMTQITSEVKAEFPDSTFMIGEFGYDTIVGSGQSVDGTANTSPEKQQGQWLVRGLLQMFAGRVDKAYLFMINGDSPGLFASSGLTRDDYSTKLGWYHVASAIEILNDAWYVNDIDTGTAAVQGHKLTDDAGNTYYALWSPTADDSETDFVLELGGNHGVVVQKDLNEGVPGGYNAPPIETVRGNAGTQQITVRVTETPTFIVVAPN